MSVVILDHLVSDFTIRKLSYSINKPVFSLIKKKNVETNKKYAINLNIKLYSQDFWNDLVSLRGVICNFDFKQKSSLLNILKSIDKKPSFSSFI